MPSRSPIWYVFVSVEFTAPDIGGQPAAQRMPALRTPLPPTVLARYAGVSAGHVLMTAAAFEILQNCGNAFDAGAAVLLIGAVTEQYLYGHGGEALILANPQCQRKVTSVNGQGRATAVMIDFATAK